MKAGVVHFLDYESFRSPHLHVLRAHMARSGHVSLAYGTHAHVHVQMSRGHRMDRLSWRVELVLAGLHGSITQAMRRRLHHWQVATKSSEIKRRRGFFLLSPRPPRVLVRTTEGASYVQRPTGFELATLMNSQIKRYVSQV